jgi:hypothetical protein
VTEMLFTIVLRWDWQGSRRNTLARHDRVRMMDVVNRSWVFRNRVLLDESSKDRSCGSRRYMDYLDYVQHRSNTRVRETFLT